MLCVMVFVGMILNASAQTDEAVSKSCKAGQSLTPYACLSLLSLFVVVLVLRIILDWFLVQLSSFAFIMV